MTEDHECSERVLAVLVGRDGNPETIFACRNWLECGWCNHRWEVD